MSRERLARRGRATAASQAGPGLAFLMLAGLLLSAAAAGLVLRVPDKSSIDLEAIAFVESTLVVTRETAELERVEVNLSTEQRWAWADFVAEERSQRGDWNAVIDLRSGLVEIAEGAGVPWIPGRGNDLQLGDIAGHLRGRQQPGVDTLESIARGFLPRVAPLLGVEGYELVLDREVSGQLSDYLWFLELNVRLGGHEIADARVFFRVNNGNLVQFGAERVPAPGTELPEVRFDLEAAKERLKTYLGGFRADRDWFLDRGRLRLLAVPAERGAAPGAVYEPGRGYALLPVWELLFRRDGEDATWRARVDAVSGEVVELVDINRYAQVTGGYWPISWRVGGAEQPQVVTGWPFVSVNPLGATSNTSGLYAWDGNPQTARHLGPYVAINDNCGVAPGTAGSDASGNIAFGEILTPNAPGDCQIQNGVSDNTPAARQQYWHVNKIKEKGRSYFPANAWLQAQLTANVNINNNCNAFWNGSTLNFYTSGGGCGNTGEDAGISMHEWGHGMDSNDGNGSSLDNGTGETYGDFTAALQTLDSCVGQGFLGGNCGGYGNACNTCDGVRDIDWGDHAQNVPWTVEAFTHLQCPCARLNAADTGCNSSYNGPCGINFASGTNNKEGHCESYVSSGALFDFANYDLRAGCGGRNATLPDWNCPGTGGPYTLAGAWGVADRLWYLSSPTRNQAFTCNTGGAIWTSHGCNAGSNWKAMRLVDDDDGNLANGTPHSCQLAAAFDRHGISCTSDPMYNVCFRGCPQPAAPALAAPAVGNNQLTLTWAPDTSPDVVDVFRNETGCGFGFAKIAEDVAFASLPLVDNAVANGTTYYYQVVRHPVGNEACGSAPSNCVSAAPAAGPSAKYVSDSATLVAVPTDNDADGFVDNCETGRIQVAIVNDGAGALTNVRFTVTSPDAAVTIATAMPVGVGNLLVSTQTTGTFDFDLDGATCGQTMSFDISVTADEMSGANLGAFTHGPVEQDLSLTASQTDDFETGNNGWTFVQGYARGNVTADSGAWSVHSSDGLNDRNDAANSPIFQKGAGASQVVIAERHNIEAPFWDRANVHAIRLSDGSHTLLTPTGRTYTAGGPWNPVGHAGTQPGWAGTNLAWGDAVFDLSGLVANESYRLEINYNTDAAVVGTGHWFDNVRWTDVSFQVCDAQSDLCVPCTPPDAPTGLAASASAANQISLAWNAVAPAPSQYRIYRSTSVGGPHTQVGTVGSGVLTFDDTGLAPGVTYFYVVRAFEICESADSNEDSATAFGDCTTPPTFAGLATVSQVATGGSCGLRLEWAPGASNCNSAPVVYNVYRATTPSFSPDPGTNLLASCVATTFYDDTAVAGGTTYYYVVRGEDDTVGNGGVCRSGNEDGNAIQGSGSVAGGTEVLLFETFDALSAGGLPAGWITGTFSGSNDWRGARACAGQSAPNVLRYGSATSCTGNYTVNSDALTVTAPVAIAAGSTNVELDFYHRWEFEDNWDGGILYASSATEFPTFYPIGPAYLSGQGYNDVSTAKGLNTFGGEKSAGYDAGTMQNTVVDLSQFCTDTAQFAANCAGEMIYVAFNGYSDGSLTRDGWHVDDVEIRRAGTACTAAPGAVQFLTATATSGQNVLEWRNPASGTYGSTLVRYSTASFPADPTDGTFLASQNDGLGGKGLVTHSGLTDGTTYYYSVFVDNGSGVFSARKTVSARPFDTSGSVKWAYSTGASALAPPGIGSVYGVANDRVLHSMDTANAGRWPASWSPMVMNAPAQDRPPIVPIPLAGATKVAFLGSQDGRVYAVNADSGAQLWSSPDLPPAGSLVQGAPAGSFAAFGGLDLIFAGTRHAAADNQVHGLNLVDGTIAWSFTNSVAQGGDGSGMGIVSGGPALDPTNGRLYFASRARAGGSQDTAWCLSFDGSSATLLWARDLGDVDGSPILLGGKLYIGTNTGRVHALDPASGSDLWASPFDANNGPVKGYVSPRFGSDQLLFSTTDRVWSIIDSGASATLGWSVASIPNPSVPLVSTAGGTPYVWVGSSDGRLYQIDNFGASITSQLLGSGAAAVGSPALDVFNEIAYVGSEEGRVYSVTLPLP